MPLGLNFYYRHLLSYILLGKPLVGLFCFCLVPCYGLMIQYLCKVGDEVTFRNKVWRHMHF